MEKLTTQLNKLNNLLLEMAKVVENNIREAIKVYQHLEEPFVVNDKIVNRYESLIEEMCIDIIIRERLYASDLRRVLGVLKLISDLERIGDHAEDILKVNLVLTNLKTKRFDDIDKMAEKALEMVTNSIKCFITSDYSLALQTIEDDNIIDEYFKNILDRLTNLKDNTKISYEFAIYTTLVVKYLERIADHAVNIAEWVIYIIDGTHKEFKI